MEIMSTAMVSAFYEYGDSVYKSRSNSAVTNSRNMGSPVAIQSLRRTTSSSPSSKSEAKQSTNASMMCNSPTREQHRKLDRSLSEPVERARQSASGSNQANSSRYKTELCRPYEENGTCKYGEKCQFAHGINELRTLVRHPKYKTELCRTFHSTGFCPYGPRCHFIHNSEETKKHLLTHLQVTGMQSIRSTGSENTVSLPQQATQTQPSRPKALSIGSFSLGSTGDLSPPSSLSGSPTSPNSFFVDEPFAVFSPSSTPTPKSVGFAPIQPDYIKTNGQYGNYSAFSNDLVLDLYRDQLVGYSMEPSPPSPVESLGSELESLSLGGSPVPATCSSPLDATRGLPRLPIFSRLANCDSD
ncbi:mRNA decay activator protein ZFP36L1-like [Centruroides sculpturatus]|uniref:mRNA decay activator protein ZFP36L1-like n=1 Tax=Centruroides sculpturatus TaxID=218467 RepID=UPI000C6EE1FF|nr:mRNA decay activator protein ZFP36L1-like [Centruroides sculpturatus]